MALALPRDELFWLCSGSDHAEAVLLTVLPTSRIPVVVATACIPARPCSCPGPYVPLAHEVAVLGSFRSVPAWFVVCGVHPPAPHCVCVRTLLLACLVVRPCVVVPPTDRVQFCPGALAWLTLTVGRVRLPSVWVMDLCVFGLPLIDMVIQLQHSLLQWFSACVLHGESNRGQASPRTTIHRMCQPQEAVQT